MKVRKVPLRTCVITGEKCPKQELLRIVKTPEGKVTPDLTGKLNGRGAYIKKDSSVLEIEMKKHLLARRLECEIPDEVYEEIRKIINN